jgi:hypothetical protein
MDDWKNFLRASFGAVGSKFALHPFDRSHARAALTTAMVAGARWSEFEAEARKALEATRLTPDEIEEQIALVRRASTYFGD